MKDFQDFINEYTLQADYEQIIVEAFQHLINNGYKRRCKILGLRKYLQIDGIIYEMKKNRKQNRWVVKAVEF